MHTFSQCLIHGVFSTRGRVPVLSPEMRARLWPYLGGIARDHGMKALAVGGMPDHVHLLLSLPPTLAVSKAMQTLKGNSSKWLRETFPAWGGASWQEGYGAFSIGVAGIDATIAYIRRQEAHHRRLTFREELERFLIRHEMTYDPAHLD